MLGEVNGLDGRAAAGHDLRGVDPAVGLVGHGDTADRAFGDRAVICHHAVKRAAADRAVVVDHLAVKDTVGDHVAVDHPAVKCTAADRARVLHRAVKRAAADDTSGVHTHGVRSTTAGRTAGDPHIAADLKSFAVVRNAAAKCSLAIAVFCMTVPDLRRAGQIDGSFIVYAAAIRITSHRRAARNTAAGHGERAFFSHEHTAAPRLKGGGSRTAHDIAALHGEPAAAHHVHAAAVNRCPDAAARAAVDNASVDGLCSVGFIQHPQAVIVGGELMLRIGSAVLDGQVYAVFHLNAGHFQHIAVQVDNEVKGHVHAAGVLDIVQQLEATADAQSFINVTGHRSLSGGARRHACIEGDARVKGLGRCPLLSAHTLHYRLRRDIIDMQGTAQKERDGSCGYCLHSIRRCLPG